MEATTSTKPVTIPLKESPYRENQEVVVVSVTVIREAFRKKKFEKCERLASRQTLALKKFYPILHE